jgi:hypothetical protein
MLFTRYCIRFLVINGQPTVLQVIPVYDDGTSRQGLSVEVNGGNVNQARKNKKFPYSLDWDGLNCWQERKAGFGDVDGRLSAP